MCPCLSFFVNLRLRILIILGAQNFSAICFFQKIGEIHLFNCSHLSGNHLIVLSSMSSIVEISFQLRMKFVMWKLLSSWPLSFDLQIEAQDIQVGNIVWLRENDEVPCDLVLIGTSDPQGFCYIEVNFYSFPILSVTFVVCLYTSVFQMISIWHERHWTEACSCPNLIFLHCGWIINNAKLSLNISF